MRMGSSILAREPGVAGRFAQKPHIKAQLVTALDP